MSTNYKKDLYQRFYLNYQKCDYSGAISDCRTLLDKSEGLEHFMLCSNLGKMLTLSGKYHEAIQVIKPLTDFLEDYKTTAMHEDLYLSYAICCLNLDDYKTYCVFISKYLETIKERKPEAYSRILKQV